MSDVTAQNVARVAEWASTFNDDVERMTSEVYAPEFLANGARMTGEKLLRFERRVLTAAPKRAIEVRQTHGVGDVTVVEGVLVDVDQGEDWKLPFCAVLTWNDGKVVSDNTYTDFSRWPGMG